MKRKKKFILKLEEKYNKQLEELTDIKNKLAEFNEDYQNKYNQAETQIEQFTELTQKVSKLHDDINKFYNEVFIDNDCYQNRFKNLYDDYLQKSNEINSFNNKLFSNQNTKTGKIITESDYNNLSDIEKEKYLFENNQYVEYGERKSIQEQIDTINKDFLEKYNKFREQSESALKQNQEENENLRNQLQKMIEELVSGATNAGLAKSYEKARNEHIQEIKKWKIIFMFCIIVMTGILLQVTLRYEFQLSLTGVIQRILLIVPIIFPFIWLGMLANKNINQNKRLYEEYLHKWVITFSFDGMKREIKELDPTEEKEYVKKLLSIYIAATIRNPSSTLDKKQQCDSPLDNLTEILKGLTQGKEKPDNPK